MSRMRMTFFVVVFLALGAIVGALAASSTQPSLEELVKEVKALTGRVNQLEKQLKSVQSGAKPGDALEKEGRVAFGQINALISDGKIDGLLDGNIEMAEASSLEELKKRLAESIQQHQAQFPGTWPPKDLERQRFIEISAGIRTN